MQAKQQIPAVSGRVSIGRRALAVVVLLRPLNLLMFCAGVFVGGFLVAGTSVFAPDFFGTLVMAALAVAAIGGAANALNDVLDVEIDRINRPDRPLASGSLPRRAGIAVWISGSLIGIGLSAMVSAAHLLIAAAAVTLLVAYSFRLKRMLLAGNVLVAGLVATSLIFGAAAAGVASEGVYAAAFAFLLTLVREIIKDAADTKGDQIVHARTLAIVFGRMNSLRFASALTAVTILLTPLPFLISGYSTLYLSTVLAADGLLLASMWVGWKADSAALDRSADLLKWAMIVGMVALAMAHALE